MLDQFDLRLLAAIQVNSRATNADLSKLVNLSPTRCSRRVERLEREGYIEKCVAILNADKLGFEIMAHTLLSVRDHTLEGNETIARIIANSPEILECFAQTGEYDLLLKIVARDLPHLNIILEKLINATGGVAAMKSSIVLKTIKRTVALPIFS